MARTSVAPHALIDWKQVNDPPAIAYPLCYGASALPVPGEPELELARRPTNVGPNPRLMRTELDPHKGCSLDRLMTWCPPRSEQSAMPCDERREMVRRVTERRQ
jgi:hypothetical protein